VRSSRLYGRIILCTLDCSPARRPQPIGSLDRSGPLATSTFVEERFTRDGNVWCSAGVSAGIDLAARVIAEVADRTLPEGCS